MYSIIVPIYKVETYLTQCIESILSQTYESFEVILVDDGSPDNCPKICDKYAKIDSRVKVIHKENGGLISARKAGLNVANGEYICFVDGDDFISCDMLENYEKILSKQKVDIICTGYSTYYDNDNIVSVSQKVSNGYFDHKGLKEEIYPTMLSVEPFYTYKIIPTVWSKCIRKDIAIVTYKDIPNDISLGEDVVATYPALLKSSSMYVIDYNGYMYRQNPNSMTHVYDPKLYKKINNLIVYLKDVENTSGWKANSQIDEYMLYLLIIAKSNEFKFNNIDTYRNKKRKFKRYLNNSIFRQVVKNVRISGLKNNFILYCFKYNIILPIYLYEKIKQKRKM